MMSYKAYTARVEYDDEAGLFHGQVLNLRDVITFQGQSVEELRREFAASVDDYLEFCAERGQMPEKPFSGQFMVRVTPALHRDIALAASRERQSINAWVAATLQRSVLERALLPPTPHAGITHRLTLSAVISSESPDLLGEVMPRLVVPAMQIVSRHISQRLPEAAYELDLVPDDND